MSRIEPYIDRILSELDCISDEKQDIRLELQDHLQQLKQEYIRKGYGEDDSEKCAIADFGEARDIGHNLQSSVASHKRLFRIGV